MPAQKRRAPTTQEAPSRRRSTRINASSGKKSQYFEADSDGDEDELSHAGGAAGVNGRKKAKVTKKATPRGKKTKVAKDVEEEPEEEDIYTYVAEDSGGETKKKEVEEEDSDDELDEDEEPRVTFIPHKKLRDTGGVGYEDDRLHKNTGLFLKDLKANNKRTWLKCNNTFTFHLLLAPLFPFTCCSTKLIQLPSPPDSQRRRVPSFPEGLEYLCGDHHRKDHRRRPDHPRATHQGRHLPHLPGYPI